MSELNVYHHELRPDEYDEFYLKYEADKVIAELKADYKEACDRLQTANLIKDEQLAAARHHKYKRCLAMARWCEDKVDAIKNGYIVSSIETRDGVMTTCPPECNPKFSFYSKWHKRWLKIAEKFKDKEAK